MNYLGHFLCLESVYHIFLLDILINSTCLEMMDALEYIFKSVFGFCNFVLIHIIYNVSGQYIIVILRYII